MITVRWLTSREEAIKAIELGNIEAHQVDRITVDGNELKRCERILNRRVLAPKHTFVGETAFEIIANWDNY